MTKEDALTMKAVLLYIIKNSSEDKRDVYCIVKTAYYAQQLHFAKWALPIFKDKICALPFGPVPSLMYDILKLSRGEVEAKPFLRKNGVDEIAEAIGWEYESYYTKDEPDMDYLSTSNIECLNEAISKVASMSFSEIKNDTHGEEWNRAYFQSSNKVMDNLNIAREAHASEEAVEYLQETLDWESVKLWI